MVQACTSTIPSKKSPSKKQFQHANLPFPVHGGPMRFGGFFSYSETLGKPCAFAPHLIGPSRNWIRKYQPRCFTPRFRNWLAAVLRSTAAWSKLIQKKIIKQKGWREQQKQNHFRSQHLPTGCVFLKPIRDICNWPPFLTTEPSKAAKVEKGPGLEWFFKIPTVGPMVHGPRKTWVSNSSITTYWTGSVISKVPLNCWEKNKY